MDRTREGEGIRANLLSYNASRADNRAIAYLDRCHQSAVGADESARADFRFIFQKSIIVAGDSARADVRPRADRRIAGGSPARPAE